MNPDWARVFQTPKIREEPAGLVGEDLLGRRRTGQVVKYLQPRAHGLRALPRRPLGSRLQILLGRLRWAQLPAQGRGVPGRAGGGGGSEPGALHPGAGLHGSDPAEAAAGWMRATLGCVAGLETATPRAAAAVLTAQFRFLAPSRG